MIELQVSAQPRGSLIRASFLESLHHGHHRAEVPRHVSARPGRFAEAISHISPLGRDSVLGDVENGCVCKITGNSKSLIVMMTLFATITGAQYVCALIAHSLALQADCISMGVDTLSYMGNLLAECQSSAVAKRCCVPVLDAHAVLSSYVNVYRRLEICMGGFSLVLLLGFTSYFIYDVRLP